MRTGKCQSCGKEDRFGSFFHVNHNLLCEPCANTHVGQLQQQKAPLQVTRPVDPTVCGLCGTDYGSTELAKAGKVPMCPACQEKVYNRDYPGWLKAGFAVTLILLAFALVHGAKYFKAGKQLFYGEHLVSTKRYAQAIAPLHAALSVAPECNKCRLVLAKAELLSGDPADAFDLVKDRKFETSDELTDVKPDFDRADQANALVGSAIDLFKKKDVDGSLAKLKEAAQAYPEWKEPAIAERTIREDQAFTGKDYDTFLQLAQQDWDKDQNSDTAGSLSSALSCKYATTGQPEYRQRAEEMFARQGKLATTAEQKASIAEFADRLHYRLTTRDIIDKTEYDRRFRKKAETAKSDGRTEVNTEAKPAATQPNQQTNTDQKSQ